MAKFYGEVDSARGNSVHRLGHDRTTVRACSWHGGVETTLYDREGAIWARIETIRWQGRGAGVLLYDGPLADMFEATPAKPLRMREAS